MLELAQVSVVLSTVVSAVGAIAALYLPSLSRPAKGLVTVAAVGSLAALTSASFVLLGPANVLQPPTAQPTQQQQQTLDILQHAVKGSVGVTAPSKATQYKPFRVEMKVAPDKLPSVLRQMQASAPVGAAVVGKDGVWLAPVMEGSVYGGGFDFEPKERQSYSQAVAAKEPTSWTWQVIPTDTGLLTLTFKLSGKFQLGEKDTLVGRDLYDRSFDVNVEVNPEGFLKRNWKEASATAGAAFAAIVGGLWAYFIWWKPAPTPRAPTPAPSTPASHPQANEPQRGKKAPGKK